MTLGLPSVAMSSPSSAQSHPPDPEEPFETENPISDPIQQDESSQDQEPESQSQTQEPQVVQNPEKSNPNSSDDPPDREIPEVILDQVAEEIPLPDNPDQENPGMSALSVSHPPSIAVVLPIPDPSGNPPEPPLTSPTNAPKRPGKRKKGKINVKRQQAIEKKLQTLMERLKPIPFRPSIILDFPRHEKLLRRLGLWDFVHIEFDPNTRLDLIAQLIATYDAKLRCSYVNEVRIMVNRADLGRALKLPVKKEKSSVNLVDGVDVDSEAMSEEAIWFVENFMSNWMLLHDDTWMMSNEVLGWMKLIKDGQPERVDWAGLFWFMVEKELTQGEQLEDCYYASHLQYLIKSQREVLLSEEPEKVELDEGMKEDDCVNEGDVKASGSTDGQEEEGLVSEGPNVELTLGQDIERKDTQNDAEMVDVEDSKEVGEEEEERGQWLLDGKDDVNEHILQRCTLKESTSLGHHEDEQQDNEELVEEDGEEQQEMEDGYDVVHDDDNFDGDGLTGNLLHGLETTQFPFTAQGHHHDQSSVGLLSTRSDAQHIDSGGPSFFGNGNKREFVPEHDLSSHGDNKRLRVEVPWDHKQLDFRACMDQMQQLMVRARMMYEARDEAEERSNMNQQILLTELQKRENIIEHLHKTKFEEAQRREGVIQRLERELIMMGNVLAGYRKALKETRKAFAEYRNRCQLPEEPVYKDAGPGGVMLSSAEAERQRLKQEEEYQFTCLLLEQKAKEAEEGYSSQFEMYLEKVILLDEKLIGLEKVVNQLKEVSEKRKISESENNGPESSPCSPNE